jgi:hypothetical protein
MQFLTESNHPAEKSFVADTLKTCDDFSSFWLLHKYFSFTKNISKTHEVVKLSGKSYPWLANLTELFQSSYQANIDLRSIRDEGTRLFCALLVSALTTEQILKIVKTYTPDRPPIETATELIGKLEKSGLISFSQNRNIAPVLRFLHEAKIMEHGTHSMEQKTKIQ